MCIDVNRWYFCPVPLPYGEALPTSGAPRIPSMPWKDWKAGDLVPEDEVGHHNMPSYPNIVYVRHLHASTIRCALVNAYGCKDTKQQTRTELFSIACPQCTYDDACIPERPPFHVHRQEHVLENLHSDNFKWMAEQYFIELQTLLSAYIHVELVHGGTPIEQSEFDLCVGAFLCTQDANHTRVSGMGNMAFDLFCRGDWCPNMFGPVYHNMSRAMRVFEAGAIRRLQPDHWANMTFESFDEWRQVWRADYYRDIPNQQWFAKTEEEEYARYCRLMAMLGENVQRLFHLGYEKIFDPEHLPTPGFGQADFKGWLEKRQELIYFCIWYAVMDPGLSAAFLEQLMRDYLFCFLIPKENRIPPENMRSVEWKFIHCPSSAWDTDRLAAEYTGNAMFNERVIEDSRRQGSERVRQMKDNRELEYAKKSRRQSQASGLMAQCPLTDPRIIEETPTCHLCADDFLAQDELPLHLSIGQMPCCRQPIHYRCLKACAGLRHRDVEENRCPYCNTPLATHMNAERWESNWAGNFGERTIDFDGIRIASRELRQQRERNGRGVDWEELMQHDMRREVIDQADRRFDNLFRRAMRRQTEAAWAQVVTEDDYHAGRLNHDEWNYMDEEGHRRHAGYGEVELEEEPEEEPEEGEEG